MKYLELNSLPDDLKQLCQDNIIEGADTKYEKVSLGPVDKFIEENGLELEFSGLLFADGRRSGLVVCSACESVLRKENGHPFAMGGVKGSYKYKSSVLLSHLTHYHLPKIQRVSKKRKLSPSQPRISSFKGPLTSTSKTKLLQQKIDMVSNLGLPLSILDSEDFKKYENLIWEMSNNNLNDFRSVPSSASKFLILFCIFK